MDDYWICSHSFLCQVKDTSLTSPMSFSLFFGLPDLQPLRIVPCEVSRLFVLEANNLPQAFHLRCFFSLGTVSFYISFFPTRITTRCSNQTFSPRMVFLAFGVLLAALGIFISQFLLRAPFRLLRSYQLCNAPYFGEVSMYLK